MPCKCSKRDKNTQSVNKPLNKKQMLRLAEINKCKLSGSITKKKDIIKRTKAKS